MLITLLQKLLASKNFMKILKVLLTSLLLILSCKSNSKDFIDTLKDSHANIIIVGDEHGTSEAPQKLYDLVTALLPHYSHIYLSLEVPPEALNINDNPIISSKELELYVAKTRFWSRGFQDGRSSQAVAKLIYKLKKISSEKLSVIALNQPFLRRSKGVKRTGHKFEKSALQVMRKIKKDELIIFSAGNLHASRKPTPQLDLSLPYKQSFAGLLSSLGQNILTFKMLFGKGSAWQCIPDKVKHFMCGERKKISDTEQRELRLGFNFYEIQKDGYDGYYYIDEISASPPLVSSL